MKVNYLFLFGLFVLFLGLMGSCSSDDDGDDVGGASGAKRLTKIEELNGDGDYKLFSYNSERNLISIEDGDEDGIQEKIVLTYNGQSISKIQLFDPELYSTMDLKSKGDTVFITGENQVRGMVNDTLIIDVSSNKLQKLISKYRTVTYNYDSRYNIISTSDRSESLSYDTNPSFYSTIGVPYWFLNYLYGNTGFMENYACPNNFLGSFGSDQYSYEYGADKYPTQMRLTHKGESSDYKVMYAN